MENIWGLGSNGLQVVGACVLAVCLVGGILWAATSNRTRPVYVFQGGRLSCFYARKVCRIEEIPPLERPVGEADPMRETFLRPSLTLHTGNFRLYPRIPDDGEDGESIETVAGQLIFPKCELSRDELRGILTSLGRPELAQVV